MPCCASQIDSARVFRVEGLDINLICDLSNKDVINETCCDKGGERKALSAAFLAKLNFAVTSKTIMRVVSTAPSGLRVSEKHEIHLSASEFFCFPFSNSISL